MRLYLAHNMALRELVRMLQLELETSIPGLELVNPFYDLGMNNDSPEKTDVELGAIKKLDGVLAILPYPTLGTVWEMAWASLHDKLVIVFCPVGGVVPTDHPFLKAKCGYVARDLQRLKETLRTLA